MLSIANNDKCPYSLLSKLCEASVDVIYDELITLNTCWKIVPLMYPNAIKVKTTMLEKKWISPIAILRDG